MYEAARVESVTQGRYFNISIKVALPDGFQRVEEEMLRSDLRTEIEELLTESGFELEDIIGGITIGSDGK